MGQSDTIVDILKQLGVKQTLSDEQIDNFAQSAAKLTLEQERQQQKLMLSSHEASFDEDNIK